MIGWLKLHDRGIIELTGPDRVAFLDRLVSNSVSLDKMTYALLLTPQGKYQHDIFVHPQPDKLLIDCHRERCTDLLVRLQKYKLRSQVELRDIRDEVFVYAHSSGHASAADPRHGSLGYRTVLARSINPTFNEPEISIAEYEKLRIQHMLPDGFYDCEPERSMPLEFNFDLANAISFTKGCYIGQELTARMHYRELVKKRLVCLCFEGNSPASGSEVLAADGSAIGTLLSTCGALALTKIPLDFKGQTLTCAGYKPAVTWPTELT